MRIMTDEFLRDKDCMPVAIRAIEEALQLKADGALSAPPRHHVTGPTGDLVFTIGGAGNLPCSLMGFRAYHTFAGPHDDQLVAVWDANTGALRVLAVGTELGVLRTGAIGGVAVRHLARQDAAVLAVIGTGPQAEAQLAAVLAVRDIRHVRVHSRTPARRAAFAAHVRDTFALEAVATDMVQAAVESADIVICATSSTTPVLEAAWLKPGAHINTLGPKTVDSHEVGIDIAAAAHRIVTDSIAQALAYASPFFLSGTPHMERLEDLASVIAAGGVAATRAPDDITLFCSTGLAGTEVLVAARLAEHLEAPSITVR